MEYMGIDVAKWQGTIDWAKVKKSGVKFAILKVTKKGNGIEESFERNYAGCIANGIDVGVYRYVYASSINAAQAEANAIVSILKGKTIKCGVWLDMEDSSIKGIGKTMLSNIIHAESDILKKAGYGVGIYCNLDWYKNVLSGKTLSKEFPFWIARYPSNDNGIYNASSSLAPKSIDNCVAWQYSSKGFVSGISGNVDMDVAYTDLVQLFGGTTVQKKTCPYARPTELLKNGSNGDGVRWWQWYLVELGFLSAKSSTGKTNIDGLFRNGTEKATIQCQKKLFPSDASQWDGKVGNKTKDAAEKML